MKLQTEPAATTHWKLENISAGDSKFIGDFLALFSDPRNAELLEQVRRGEASIFYAKSTGCAIVMPVFKDN